jgi:hypothetical protein
MADKTYTKLSFPAYALRIPDVATALDKESPEEDDAYIDPRAAPKGKLHAIASDTYGEFEFLQPVLVRLRIPFDLWTEADHESAEKIVHYRPGETRKQDYSFTQTLANGEAVVSVAEIQRATKTKAGIRKLIEARDVPPLRDLTEAPARLTKLLILPDPAITREYEIRLYSHAIVHGSVRVTATSEDEAKQLAKAKTGDVIWEYQALVNDTEADVAECRAVE